MLAERLKQARLALGMTQDAVIDRLERKITKAALSNYEKGKRTPESTILKMLTRVYGVKVAWFFKTPELRIQWFVFRAAAKLSARKREEIQSFAANKIEQYLSVADFFSTTTGFGFAEQRDIASLQDVDTLALEVRKKWNLGMDAIESVTQCLENHGVMLLHWEKDPIKGFDGLSARINNAMPLIFVNSLVSVDRLRFDLLHELGHVLMAPASDPKQDESYAHRFASTFLIPPEVLRRELGEQRRQLTLYELLLIKEKYGISVAALLYAVTAQGIVSRNLSTMLWIELGRRGWKKQEPDVFRSNEAPTRLRQLTVRAVAEGILSADTAVRIAPDIRAELQEEGLLDTGEAVKMLTMDPEERNKLLRSAAARAAQDYEAGGDLSDISDLQDGDLHEYE